MALVVPAVPVVQQPTVAQELQVVPAEREVSVLLAQQEARAQQNSAQAEPAVPVALVVPVAPVVAEPRAG
ncbi:hypothetical protein [Corynebacterium meitnerae]|uniref:Uncharacterized protein n=1 Tax=Corynebacterium meitnerae TaxID=2913498 RepID=A0A9X3LUB6_9CORY|nr:hypothetical protein [Corynebacterium meitnerae]MCZ9293926.1 hypothetical protein [Corynebacterium meitnerae]